MNPNEKAETLFSNFPGHDRFDLPEGIYCATAGRGGESFLITGGRKTALYDCGMAFCHKGLIENIESILSSLGRTTLDVVLMSHTHYDHIGALPYVLDRWPDAEVMGAAKAISVFASDNAKATMKELGTTAARDYGSFPDEEIKVEGMRVDRVLKDGDTVDLGGRYFAAYETPGHTDCSMSFHLFPDDILFLSESTGLTRGPELMHGSILKSFRQCVESTYKCEAIGAKRLVSPHYGIVPEWYTEQYYKDFLRVAFEQYDMVREMLGRGESYDAILDEYVARYWSDRRSNSQPLDAFLVNSRITVRNLIDTVMEDEKCQL